MSQAKVRYEILLAGASFKLEGAFLGLCNVVLVTVGERRMLFDVGHYSTRPALLAALEQRGLTPDDIDGVFLSHLHFDHCHNIDLFRRATVYASRAEWDYAAAPDERDPFVPWMIREQLETHDLELLEGEVPLWPGLRCLPVPGHTAGSYALVLEGARQGPVVLAGDAIKYPKEILTGRSEAAFVGEEVASESIRRITEIAQIIVPGHFPELRRENHAFVWDQGPTLCLTAR